MRTTLNKIRKHSPCPSGWQKLLTYLGKTKSDDEPLEITTIIDSNGLNDALWCLRAVEGHDREISLYTVWCARQVQHLLKDQRSLEALDVAERYANGEATKAELDAAADTARAAAWSSATWATWAARDAAWAAEAAAWGAARDAAEAACWAAALAAAEYAEYAEYAESAAWAAAEAAAWGDARAKQEAELRRICGEGE